MIALWGLSGDGPLEAVRAALVARQARFVVIDQRNVLDTAIELTPAAEPRATVVVRDERHALHETRGSYWRTYDLRRLPAVQGADDHDAALRHAEAVEHALLLWLELTPSRVVNRPSDMASNGSKPYQLELIRAQGFEVPDTLVTNDPEAIRRFWTDSGAVIYKSCSGVRSIVTRLDTSHLRRLQDVMACPTQFQKYVPGTDLRVHVVGDDLFASEIVCDAADYRYAARTGDAPQITAFTLPAAVAERCHALASSLRLPLAGIDLRRTPDDRWFCFEVNPSPGFTYYESHTSQPIAAAVASLLASA